jgi:uncharacterized membrane protein (DUF485 family)
MSAGPQPKLRVEAPAAEPVPRWSEAFESDLYRSISHKRSAFVVPVLILFSAVFLVLWVIQASFPAIARYRVYGWVNLNFVYTMLIFPVVWVLGVVFVRYTRRHVYPLEEELHRRFAKGAK